jgi:hypothetical protein
MVRAVTSVLRRGRCGSTLFQRDSGDLTLRVLTRERRGGSKPSRTAWPTRPVRLGSVMMTPAARVRVCLAVSRAVVKLARSGSVPGTVSAAVDHGSAQRLVGG